jgi:hypothetical protein
MNMVETYIDAWNERCQPFTWTKTADETRTKATAGQRASFTRQQRPAPLRAGASRRGSRSPMRRPTGFVR